MSKNRIGTTLLRLLKDERSALLAGKLDQAAKLSARKSDLIDQFQPEACDARLVADIGRQAVHNQGLLDSARRGIEAAQSRVKEILVAGQGNTYSILGQKQPLQSKRPTLQKRA